MTTVTLQLSEAIIQRARTRAVQTGQKLEDILVEWIDRQAQELPTESLSDQEVVLLSNLEMAEQDQAELNRLLEINREGKLDQNEQIKLDVLMEQYRTGMIRKAEALRVAAARGLPTVIHEKG